MMNAARSGGIRCCEPFITPPHPSGGFVAGGGGLTLADDCPHCCLRVTPATCGKASPVSQKQLLTPDWLLGVDGEVSATLLLLDVLMLLTFDCCLRHFFLLSGSLTVLRWCTSKCQQRFVMGVDSDKENGAQHCSGDVLLHLWVLVLFYLYSV